MSIRIILTFPDHKETFIGEVNSYNGKNPTEWMAPFIASEGIDSVIDFMKSNSNLEVDD